MRNENVGAYPRRWPQIAERVRRLNGFRCERCRHPSIPHTDKWNLPCDAQCTHSGIGDGKPRTLTVHHLDGNKSNVRLWNLAALCQVCHLQIQGRVAWYQLWPFGHTPWMQKHVDRYERERTREALRAHRTKQREGSVPAMTDRLVLVGYRCVECAVVLHEGNAMLKPVRRTGSDGEIIEEKRAVCVRCLTGEKPQ